MRVLRDFSGRFPPAQESKQKEEHIDDIVPVFALMSLRWLRLY